MSAVLQERRWPLLSHFSKKPLGQIVSKPQPGDQPGWASQHKPFGLWVSVDGEDDWASWCEAESYGIGGLRYRVSLSEPERLLWITTPLDLLVFTERYDKPVHLGRLPPRAGQYIDWPRVASDYPGIVIAPYIWSLRLDDRTGWYYGWDCASGCIWDAGMIASTELLTGDNGNG